MANNIPTNAVPAGNQPVTAAEVPQNLKAKYVGTGFVMGIFSAPVVKGVLEKVSKLTAPKPEAPAKAKHVHGSGCSH